jgi:hypothetical protein
LYNTALPLLSAVKDTLTILEIRDCRSITDKGIRSLKNLKYAFLSIKYYNIKNYWLYCFIISYIFVFIFYRNLKTLKLVGMPYLEDKASLRKELTEALPDCEIEFK